MQTQGEITIKSVFQLLTHTYRSEFKNIHPEDLNAEAKIWATLLGCYDPDLVFRATVAFINSDTRGFSPKIGQIKEMMFKLKYRFPDFEELWNIFVECNKYSYSSQKCWDELPEVLKEIVSVNSMYEFSFSTSDYLRSKFKESLEVRYEKYVDNLRIDFVDNWTQEKTIVEKVQLLDVNYKPKRYRLVFVPEQKEYTYVLATD